MQVLITGANGQLGRSLQRCAPKWAEINALERDDCDFSEIAMLTARLIVEAPDVIINAAAYTAVDQAENEEDLARIVNADAVAAMAEAMSNAGGKLVHISCDLVFDGTATQPYRPDDAPYPVCAYGRTKAQGEKHLCAEDLLVRTSRLYAAGGNNFVSDMIRIMNARDQMDVIADQVASPTWTQGLARTIWSLVERNASGTYHHCDDGFCSWHEFAVVIAEEAHGLGLIAQIPAIRAVASQDYPSEACRPTFSGLDCSATRALLKDQSASWRANLRLMLEEEATSG
ncbi:MAG: dTDP-4-dehydrorhamnose reductase [Sphingomonadales bacterium]|nr:dTDP-4-dehydrorhamnose reductase [Sphingomonadales bacterium]NCQ22731.1 dTDP-4-dehydrorhamnose reductase [Sphingomonadales bacterium]